MIRWGLIPNWATDPKKVPNPFNARAESVRDKPLFADLIEGGGRCLIPADGFCEWKAEGKKKVPHHFKLRSGAPFAFAGLYDVWRGDGKATFSTCLITNTANDVVKPVHDRMPVMLAPADFTRWLDRETELPDVLSLLRPYPAEAMEAVREGFELPSKSRRKPQFSSKAARNPAHSPRPTLTCPSSSTHGPHYRIR